jgi:hypothetical protein
MKEETAVKIRKTCGNCELYDRKHEICSKSEFFVNPDKGRPNCKNWKLNEALALATALPPIPKIIKGPEIPPVVPIPAPEEVVAQEKPAPLCTRAPMDKETEEVKEPPVLQSAEELSKIELPHFPNGYAKKEHPMRRFLKRIGIVK